MQKKESNKKAITKNKPTEKIRNKFSDLSPAIKQASLSDWLN